MSDFTLSVFRDFENRRVGEPDDGPLAWQAHRAREAALRELLSDPAFLVDWTKTVATDTERPHELADLVVNVLSDPTTQTALTVAAIYVGKLVAAQIDKITGNAVARVFGGLVALFKKRKVGDFWITLPDGSRIAVDPDSKVNITLEGGKAIAFHVDSPPAAPTAGN